MMFGTPKMEQRIDWILDFIKYHEENHCFKLIEIVLKYIKTGNDQQAHEQITNELEKSFEIQNLRSEK